MEQNVTISKLSARQRHKAIFQMVRATLEDLAADQDVSRQDRRDSLEQLRALIDSRLQALDEDSVEAGVR